MMRIKLFTLILVMHLSPGANAQVAKEKFTKADTLRGSVGPARGWWDVLRYDLSIKPDIAARHIKGTNEITYKVVSLDQPGLMQIDLMEPLKIDRVILDEKQLDFVREGNVYHIKVPAQDVNSRQKIKIDFSGYPRIAPRAPWDGGWTFASDSLGRPWLTVTCQGLGASVWYPNKDHQSDEPDWGAGLTMTIPDTLVAVSNGKLVSTIKNADQTVSYKWNVVNPINNYNIIPYIGKYVNFFDVFDGEKGNLDVNYWVLDYNLPNAKNYLPVEVHNMLRSFEYWFGPYPFYEDGYSIIDVPHTGMEHQSAIAYGNWYQPGYRGRDGSGSGWGLRFDFIVVHESGHEWFGNNITTKDLADMWVHESFANYSETLLVDYMFGKAAADEYNFGIRKGIKNDRPIIPAYGVNAQGSGDMYAKGGNMLHTIRHSMNNDLLFRQILRGLNARFYHSTVTSGQIENYISHQAGFDYSKVFDQYLRNTQIPEFEYYIAGDTLHYRYANCVNGFNLPISIKNGGHILDVKPVTKWQKIVWPHNNPDSVISDIEKYYYLKVKEIKSFP